MFDDKLIIEGLRSQESKKYNKFKITVLVMILLLVISYSIDVDYYLMRPGSAEHLRPLVSLEGGAYEEEGQLMLTTVSSMPANLLFYLLAHLDSHIEIEEKVKVVGSKEMDDETYRDIMKIYMNQSQNDAIYNAFHLAGKEAEYIEKAVLIRDVGTDSKAYNILKSGDIIYAVDGHKMKNTREITEYIKAKKPGDMVTVDYERNGEARQLEVELIKSSRSDQTLIGITIFTDVELETEDKVIFDTGKIGGSSAGLMFTLEIYNQLTPDDITKGYKIAGTGTIDYLGNVGQIGGVQHKVSAAQKAKVDIFFVPKDIEEYDTNEAMALERNSQLRKPITIVPVANVREAIEYLDRLPNKNN